MRKDAVAYVDAFVRFYFFTSLHHAHIGLQAIRAEFVQNIPDFVLGSPMGARDGDVYRRYLETVKSAPNATGVPPYWKVLIQPMLRADL